MGQQVAGAAGQQMAAGGAIQVRCSNCNTLNPESAKFCSSCGQALTAPAPAPAGATVKCPECGTENAATAKFCVNCGHSFAQAPAAAEPAASAAPASPEGGRPPEGGATPPPAAPEAQS
jgi:rRNA maturation endonuclease Nob1